MQTGVDEIEVLLRDRGYALTPQRRAILRLLADQGGHWTAPELVQALSSEYPLASRATVYSTLTLLRELGVLSLVPGPGGELRYDANREAHHHFLCRGCGRLEDIPQDSLKVGVAAGLPGALQVERFQVVAEGLCPSCR